MRGTVRHQLTGTQATWHAFNPRCPLPDGLAHSCPGSDAEDPTLIHAGHSVATGGGPGAPAVWNGDTVAEMKIPS